MAISVKKIVLWRSEVEHRPGVLAGVLDPLARAGASLKCVMGYRFPGGQKAAIELYPVAGKKTVAAAHAAGLAVSSIPTLLIEGDDRPGLGHAFARALAEAGINIAFLVAHVTGRKYSAVIGMESEADAKKAVPLIRKAAASRKK